MLFLRLISNSVHLVSRCPASSTITLLETGKATVCTILFLSAILKENANVATIIILSIIYILFLLKTIIKKHLTYIYEVFIFLFYFFLLSITYVLPGVTFARCFTCAAVSPISRTLWNLPSSTTTTPTDIVVIGNCSNIPFLFGTSK